MTPITLTATLEDPTPNATGLVKVRFERPEGIVFAWVPPGAIHERLSLSDALKLLRDASNFGSLYP